MGQKKVSPNILQYIHHFQNSAVVVDFWYDHDVSVSFTSNSNVKTTQWCNWPNVESQVRIHVEAHSRWQISAVVHFTADHSFLPVLAINWNIYALLYLSILRFTDTIFKTIGLKLQCWWMMDILNTEWNANCDTSSSELECLKILIKFQFCSINDVIDFTD